MKRETILFCISTLLVSAILLNSCSTSEKLSEKSGVQLWGENCSRCHSVPPPSAYSDYGWEIIGTHMRIRANLTYYEETKIVEFLKTANEN
ncbi:MAG: cytochrome c [Bacteroidetes bacterium]|nr:MAG: cytochrome c [Bacteroidota bacterium]